MTGNAHLYGRINLDPTVGQKSIILSFKNSKKNIEVRISPFFGSNIYRFKYNGVDIFHCDVNRLKNKDWTGCFILWPLPNRVRNKKFEFEGKTYDLTPIKRKRGNYSLIHGLVDDKIWQICKIKKTNEAITASTFIEILPGTEIYKYFPFTSKLKLTFRLNRNGLKIKYAIKNLSKKKLPYGFALHPYFSVLSGKTNIKIKVPAKSVMETDKELLPTGKMIDALNNDYDLNQPTTITKLSLDHVYTDLDEVNKPFIDYTDKGLRVHLESSKDFTHLVVYTKEDSYFCLENQTGATDMINLHAIGLKEKNSTLIKASHLLTILSGKQRSGYIFYRIEEY